MSNWYREIRNLIEGLEDGMTFSKSVELTHQIHARNHVIDKSQFDEIKEQSPQGFSEYKFILAEKNNRFGYKFDIIPKFFTFDEIVNMNIPEICDEIWMFPASEISLISRTFGI